MWQALLASSLAVMTIASMVCSGPLRADESPPAEPDQQKLEHDRETYWAVGIGLSGISLPDYVGSNQRRYLPLPFPYVVYESKRVTFDQGILSGALLLTDRAHLEISAGGALPVSSSQNKARRDMRDLDAVGEIGPSLKWDFYHSSSGEDRLILDLPLRTAIGASLSFDEVRYVGLISNPNIEFRRDQPASDGLWTFRASIGPVFSDERYNNYYYGVPQHDARAGRPAYAADGGYGGWRISGGFSRRWRDFWFGGFVRYINLNSAVFADSPLVRTENYLIGGLAVAWVFASSKDK